MTEDAHENESGWTAYEGVSEESGQSISPDSLPDDDASANSTAHKEVPIGRPISDKQYKKLKEAAEKKKPPSGGKAQVDPST